MLTLFPHDVAASSLTRRSCLRGAGLAAAGCLVGGALGSGRAFAADPRKLARQLAKTPPAELIDMLAEQVAGGLQVHELLAGLVELGSTTVDPHPGLGAPFQAVVALDALRTASHAVGWERRWLPLGWAALTLTEARLTSSEAGWVLPDAPGKPITPDAAWTDLVRAFDGWDLELADRAIIGACKKGRLEGLFEVLCRYGLRDFRFAGNKPIATASLWTTLAATGFDHAEPVLRALLRVILHLDGAASDRDLAPEEPWMQSTLLLDRIPATWLEGEARGGRIDWLRAGLREAESLDAARRAVELLRQEVPTQTVWDALHITAAELLAGHPEVPLASQAVVLVSQLRTLFETSADDRNRRLALLQAASLLVGMRQLVLAEVGSVRFTDVEPPQEYWEPSFTGPRLEALWARTAMKARTPGTWQLMAALAQDWERVSPFWRARLLYAVESVLPSEADPDHPEAARILERLSG